MHGASHSSPGKRGAGAVDLGAKHAAAVAVAEALELEDLVEQQRRHDRCAEQLRVGVRERGAGARAAVDDERRGGRPGAHLRGNAPAPDLKDLEQAFVPEVLQLRVVVRRVHDHLVPADEGGVLVGDDADPPAGGIGGAAGRPHDIDLRRGERFVAGAEWAWA